MDLTSHSQTQPSSPFWEETHHEYREIVRQFTAKEITPHVHEWDVAGEVPRELYNKAGSIGIFGDGFDEKYGGHGQRDALMRVAIMQELCKSASGGVVAALFSNYISLPLVHSYGSDEMKQRVISPCQSGAAIAALAVTEPSGGSDVARITTTAVDAGDHYLVNGSKTFITSGMRADFFVTAVRTGGEGSGGISLLLIDGDTPGVERTKLDKMGWLASDTATIYFGDVQVPKENLIGPQDAGFATMMKNFNGERLDLAVQSTTFARVCLDEALNWAAERKTFGKTLNSHQVIRHKLVEMDRLINASEAWNLLLAWRINQGEEPVREIAEAKVAATTTFEMCAREAAQILGGASYLRGETVERLYREVRVQAIGGGSEEIMRDLAAKHLLKRTQTVGSAK